MVSLRDTAISRDYGCPEPGQEEEVFAPWRAGVRGLISAVNANNPRVGWFSPSCEVHTISGLTQERKDSSVQSTFYSDAIGNERCSRRLIVV